MISVVTWKWRSRFGRTVYTSAHVNRLAAAVARCYTLPHRVICVTDDPAGLATGVEFVRDFGDFADVPSPHGNGAPSCYRRLRAFHPEAARWFGERFVCLDLDFVPVGDLVPLWERFDDFVIYRDPIYAGQYNGSMFMLRAGARPEVWADFLPNLSRRLAIEDGKRGSDQGWISYRLPGEATWGPEDGVYSYRAEVLKRGGDLPAGATAVVFHGSPKPWDPGPQLAPWVRAHWGAA